MNWKEQEDWDLVSLEDLPDEIVREIVNVPCTVEHCKTKKRKRIPGGECGEDWFEYPEDCGDHVGRYHGMIHVSRAKAVLDFLRKIEEST